MIRPVHVPPPPVSLAEWWTALKRRHWHVLVSHPHHYVTASGLTLFLFLIGHFEAGAIWTAWGYAMMENLSTAAEQGV
jgi:hypothetical protein